jgi:DNA-binding NarL/FixJ family response regulator
MPDEAGGAAPSPEPVRVLLVTDVRLHRELLADALAGHDGIELAGSAPSDVAATAAAMFEPSVVIVNIVSAAAVVDELHAFAVALPDAKIVAVGVPSDDDAIMRIDRTLYAPVSTGGEINVQLATRRSTGEPILNAIRVTHRPDH